MLLHWVKFKNNPGTPDPNAEENPSEARAVASANENVIEATDRPKRKPYHVYDASTQAKIARFPVGRLCSQLRRSVPHLIRGQYQMSQGILYCNFPSGPNRTRTAPIAQRVTSVKSEPFYVFSDPRASTETEPSPPRRTAALSGISSYPNSQVRALSARYCPTSSLFLLPLLYPHSPSSRPVN
ncbi:hypothetical protein EOD39_7104 [Acipenser ruthenus]|uniref:Uncharacterized protein n=1 Tax=Acipenser ruthenus TaxID=7906 RepID=A0A444U828_ACIRT|nr:hypothetical protein EOD39_7104 [Acipenser ruthenus]